MDLLKIKQKQVVAVFGYEINLIERTREGINGWNRLNTAILDVAIFIDLTVMADQGSEVTQRRSARAEDEDIPESIPLKPEP